VLQNTKIDLKDNREICAFHSTKIHVVNIQKTFFQLCSTDFIHIYPIAKWRPWCWKEKQPENKFKNKLYPLHEKHINPSETKQ